MSHTGFISITRLRLLAWATALSCLASPAVAQDPAATPVSTGSGPYPAVMLVDASLPTHTLYRPRDLPTVALPVVGWAEGGCVNDGSMFREFLTEIASYGYFVMAIGPNHRVVATEGVLPPPPADGTQPKGFTPTTHSHQLIDAIDWAGRENLNPRSPYYHHLDLGHVAMMGQSCGGAQALEASTDPRVTTTVMWNSGLWNGVTDMGGGMPLTKDYLQKLHAPIAYISGDRTDMAFSHAEDDFTHITRIPALRAWRRGVPHTGTYHEPDGGEYAGVAVGWLNWQLKGDQRAGRLFVGADCGLCVNPRWVVDSRNLR